MHMCLSLLISPLLCHNWGSDLVVKDHVCYLTKRQKYATNKGSTGLNTGEPKIYLFIIIKLLLLSISLLCLFVH